MDMWHVLGRVFRVSNLGTLIFFLLNVTFILIVFCPYGIDFKMVSVLIVCYIVTVFISLSPFGEWVLLIFAGAKDIKRKDIKIRLIPLLEIVFEQAKEKNPTLVSSINLKIIYNQPPNAFAIGRKTICVTDGLLNLSDKEIMAVFAHEMGHIVYKHSVIQLLIGGSNILICCFLLFIKIISWIILGIFTLVGISTKSILGGVLIFLFGSVFTALIWIWTKFCMLFLMWSMRQNEFIADEYAHKLGYGIVLAGVLDKSLCLKPNNGFLKALYSSHPSNNDRIARLQKLGADYYGY